MKKLLENASTYGCRSGFRQDTTIQEDGPEVGMPKLGLMLSNLHSEISELWEAARKGKLDSQCDKPVELNCAGEELADILIRLLDTARYLGMNVDEIERAVAIKLGYNETRPRLHGGKLA